MPLHRHRPVVREAGFTLVELIVVVVIIATLAVFVMPKALDLGAWQLRAFADNWQAQSMAMQRLALTTRRPVTATVTATGVSFAYAGGGTIQTLSCPSSATPCIGVSGTPTVTFDAANSGSTLTSTGAALAITIASGSTTLNYQIENETGLFHTVP